MKVSDSLGILATVCLLGFSMSACGRQASESAAPAGASNTPSSTSSPTGSAPTPSDPSAVLTCGDWAKPGSDFYRSVEQKYGEIDDCGSASKVWFITTDRGSTGPGVIGISACPSDCSIDTPDTISDWHFLHPSNQNGIFSRFAGVNKDGTLLFTGGSGEVAFDPTTDRLTPEAEHE